MSTINNSFDAIQKTLTSSLQNITNASMAAMKPVMDSVMSNMNVVNKSVLNTNMQSISLPQIKLQQSNCCTPQDECPPHCIAAITRCAMPNERIIVPFMVKNNCSTAKTYRIGVRELKDEDGQMAPSQPELNKQSITLQPGRSERVLLGIDLGKFKSGSTYNTEIVLREKEINQNICFTLKVDDECDTVTAEPKDEQKYNLRWQSWQSHFYCEPPKQRRTNTITNDNK
jgi:hypothetical protein